MSRYNRALSGNADNRAETINNTPDVHSKERAAGPSEGGASVSFILSDGGTRRTKYADIVSKATTL